MEVCIFTFPSERSLEKEIKCIKAALLYSDKVRLLSANAAMHFAISQFKTMSHSQHLGLLGRIAPLLVPDSIFSDRGFQKKLNEVVKGKRFPQRYPEIDICWQALKTYHKELTNFSHGVFKHAGGEHLVSAVEKGFLEVSELGVPIDSCFEEYLKAEILERSGKRTTSPRDIMAKQFFIELDQAVRGQKTPFFDSHVMQIVKNAATGLPEGTVQKEPHFASILFNRLPTFETEPIPKVLDLRDALSNKRKRFIGALNDLCEELEAEVWDDSFRHDAIKLIQSKVEPVIEEVEDELQSSDFRRFFKNLVTTASGKSGALGVAVTGLAQLSGLNWISLLMPYATAGSLGLKSYFDTTQEKTEVRRKAGKLLLYLDAKQHLS